MNNKEIMSALEEKAKDIHSIFDKLITANSSIDEKYHKTINALNNNSNQNIAIAYVEDLLPDKNNNYIFASSAFGGIESSDTNLINELNNINTSICTMEVEFNFTYQRLNDDLEFEDALPEGFPNKNPNCCERSIVEYISKIHREEIEKIYATGGQKSDYSDFKKNDLAARTGLTGSIYIFTVFEPCLYCYALLKKLQKDNPYLTLKIYYPQIYYTGKSIYEIFKSMEEEYKRRRLKNEINDQIKNSTLKEQEVQDILKKIKNKTYIFTAESLEKILELIRANNSKKLIIETIEKLKEK